MTPTYNYSNGTKYATKDVWDAAIGLQQVDGLSPSKYLLQLADDNVNGKLTLDEIEKLLYDHYEKNTDDTKEADIVAKRIADLLSDDSFSFSPVMMTSIHGYLFGDIMPTHAGKIRKVNLTKSEPILHGETVKYANWINIAEQMKYDFETERCVDYSVMSQEEVIKHIAAFTRNIWQTHPFMEGNTRTTAVFIEMYLNSKGFNVNNDLFSEKSQYFRNALVRANYADYSNKIYETSEFIEKFYENLLFQGTHELTNKELICFSLFPNKTEV